MSKSLGSMPLSDPDGVRQTVRDSYTAVADGVGLLAVVDARSQAEAFGYDVAALGAAPAAANLGLGCGNPTGRAGLADGEVVLDLGCGAGIDVFIASRSVGPSGRVIGVDMTAALLDQAAATAVSEGYDNVEFRLGDMEHLPVEDNEIDVIVSNCAINLSPEKHRVFAEAARVLRPGGRIQVSDLVVEVALPDEIRESVEAYVGCVGGAVTMEEYTAFVRDAGFEDIEVSVAFALGDIVAPDDARVREVLADAGASYAASEVAEVLASIKSLSVSARMAGSVPACCEPRPVASATSAAPTVAVDGPATGRMYTDVLSYVVSNAVAGEIMAVENYSDMVSMFDDIDAKLEAVNQARDEGRHVKQLASLGQRLGFDVKQRVIEPEWKSIRATFREAVTNDDLAACLVIQDLMTESMAIVLYRTLSGSQEVETDALTAQVATTILEDEIEHLAIGTARLRQLRALNPENVDAALAWAHPRVMPELFSLVSTSCESLCDQLSLVCEELDPGALGADLDLIRARAATQYGAAIDAVGFSAEVTGPLFAHLAALEQTDADSRISTGSCC